MTLGRRRVIDLERVRAALRRLEDIARRFPHLTAPESRARLADALDRQPDRPHEVDGPRVG